MKKRELQKLGLEGELLNLGMQLVASAKNMGLGKRALREELKRVVKEPTAQLEHPYFGVLAERLVAKARPPVPPLLPREQVPSVKGASPAPSGSLDPRLEALTEPSGANRWRQWGEDLDEGAVRQMQNACSLPVAVRGALMPDAHVGYGLPIGGVLATENAVIPYAVGVDIACRVKLSVLDLPAETIKGQPERLIKAIEGETRFGVGASFKRPHEHEVMDRNWSVTPITRSLRDKAWQQLGTSGSGNHFVEFGVLSLQVPQLGLEPGEYLALLSHSGSRGAGSTVASHYSKLAMAAHPELPKELRHLAWLDMASEEGQAYWAAMELMGRYASANHAVIHRQITRHLGAHVLASVENHHNFAWRESHDGRELVVHRKGATPAAAGLLGIIPGSMASPAYVVRGKGSREALYSAAHGAGRVMSRRAAKESLTWSQAKRLLAERGVTLLSAGLDEVPMVYKDIDWVMARQEDLVEPLARFEPKIVKMAPAGERPED